MLAKSLNDSHVVPWISLHGCPAQGSIGPEMGAEKVITWESNEQKWSFDCFWQASSASCSFNGALSYGNQVLL